MCAAIFKIAYQLFLIVLNGYGTLQRFFAEREREGKREASASRRIQSICDRAGRRQVWKGRFLGYILRVMGGMRIATRHPTNTPEARSGKVCR